MDPQVKAQAFKTQVQHKIQKLIAEFAEGIISREQFHIIYERYTGQLTLADMASSSNQPDMVMGLLHDMPPTYAVKQAHMGKAVGIAIFHNRTLTQLETLGDFDVAPDKLAPILNDYTLQVQRTKMVEREVRKISAKQWLVFAAGSYSTVVTLFRNEPSELQIREIMRLHRDFEEANRPYFEAGRPDKTKLAYPFLTFVQRKVQGTAPNAL